MIRQRVIFVYIDWGIACVKHLINGITYDIINMEISDMDISEGFYVMREVKGQLIIGEGEPL